MYMQADVTNSCLKMKCFFFTISNKNIDIVFSAPILLCILIRAQLSDEFNAGH